MPLYSRRSMIGAASAVPWAWSCARPKRPNILFAIADDWSWPFASIYGDRVCQTPAFDRVAREGVLFNNAFVSSPSCTPSRGSILTGRPFWQLESGANLFGPLPAKFETYPDRLERSGYFVGYTGKGWSPGDFAVAGRSRNPAGTEFNRIHLSPPSSGINRTAYVANFLDFLKQRPAGAPFCFWYGSFEPHRAYERGSGLKAGKKLSEVRVPACLPDTEEVRSDLLDYALEVEWSDSNLGTMLKALEDAGELDNTIVAVTGDNGLPFPRCKTSLYDTGARVPLAIRWPAGFRGGRSSHNFVSLPDLAPTFLEAAALNPPKEMPARSLLGLLRSSRDQVDDPTRQFVITGRERHVAAQTRDSAGYPMRALRTRDHLFIRNYKPDRYPSGAPDGGQLGPYGDIDGSPTKDMYLRCRNHPAIRRYFDLATALRPQVELYDLRSDPEQLENVAGSGGFESVVAELSARLDQELKRLEDPRAMGQGNKFDAYPPPNLPLYRGTR